MTTQIDTGTDELLCALDGHVATLTLNRPDKRNGLSVNLTPARLNAFRALIVRTEQIIAQAQTDGALRDDIKPRYMSTFFLGALETMVSTLVLNNQPLKGNRLKKRITENLLTQFFDGARPAAH